MRSNRTLDDLPDDILGRVLDLLPTKERGMSEVVSKSWRRASLGKEWERICLGPIGPAQVRWLKLLANRNAPSLRVFEGVFTPETPVPTVLLHVDCFHNLRHLELKAMFLGPMKMVLLRHLTNLEWLDCGYAPRDLSDDEEIFDEDNELHLTMNLDNFANFSQLRHLAAVLWHPPCHSGDPIWRVDLGSRFSGLTQLRSLKLGHIYSLEVDANLLQVAARLETFELDSLNHELTPAHLELDAPQLTRFVYNVAQTNGGALKFPLRAAHQLSELTLEANKVELVTQVLDVCPKLTALDLALYAKTDAEDVRQWPDMTMLQGLDIANFVPSHPYVLHPFSALTSLERLELRLCSSPARPMPAVLASPNSMQHLKVLTLDSWCQEPFNLGGGLNHLQGLEILHLTVGSLKGEINLRSLEVLKVAFESFEPDIKSGHWLVGNLPRLHTLHVVSEFQDATAILVVAHAIGALRSVRDLVLLRMFGNRCALKDFQDVGFTRTMLRSLSNTANMYNHVVIMDHGAVVLERSTMPHAKHLELACSSLSLDSEQTEEDWFHRTNSLRIRLPSSSTTNFLSFESVPASIVENLGSNPRVKIRRIQRRISSSSTSSYTDYIEASKQEFSSLPPEFSAHSVKTWSGWSFAYRYQYWD